MGPTEPREAKDSECQLVDDFLRTIIEITDTMVTHALPKNPELVYALLHNQELLHRISRAPGFAPLLENLQTVITHFNAHIDEASGREASSDGGSGSVAGTRPPQAAVISVSSVLSVIEVQLRSWRPSQLRPVAELKFTYEEAAGSEEFFLPYLWTLVTASPWLSFPSAGVATGDGPTAPTASLP